MTFGFVSKIDDTDIAEAVRDLDATETLYVVLFFFSSRRRHTRFDCDWSSDVCSSDLPRSTTSQPADIRPDATARASIGPLSRVSRPRATGPPSNDVPIARPTFSARSARSEEHTSELQSQSNLVCRLLLEKKKQ